jgi:hypothetical protein
VALAVHPESLKIGPEDGSVPGFGVLVTVIRQTQVD